MKKKLLILGVAVAAFMFNACVDDLDISPKNPDTILSGNLGDDPLYMEQVLGKLYASFIIAGQGANGGADISSSDEAFFTTMRALWNLQELPTDEGICAWGDVGIADLNTQTWSPSNPFLTALYQRLGLSITYANDFIGLTNGNNDPEVVRYNAEARFLRALAYFWQMDLFGNPPFTTEEDGVGKFYPQQIQRADLFNYIEGELLAIEDLLSEPGTSSQQADQGALWMLLARMYLNAEVYTGTPRWDDVVTYTNKVISSGAYSLNDNYRHNFSADNHFPVNPEMIFAWEQDGIHTQGPVGTTFIIQSSSDAEFIPAGIYHDLPGNPNWNGNRARKDFLNVLVDTLAVYGGDPIPASDTIFAQSPDSRVFLRQKKSIDIPSASSSGDYGVGVYKFTGRNADGSRAANYSDTYASTDFPVFRFADAYLMRAEALFRTNKPDDAVADINKIRERAFGNTSGNITSGQLTAEFLLAERGREFYYEAQRRTDLVRFGQFTNGSYHWQWKGGVFEGTATSSHLNIYPIPGDEVSANPNMKQNKDY
ncbi:RagB/SusD family nutrient uptake outer membrane protein [Geofilum rhodophaeum]|uniref:RagB/SusD family nutrient uptake outer membrane protein n=1 Tax=Geofilum rhodophaeum TaxID=1965019 RepID=UPI000B525E51|nr:RagB/SusD family nutrient uptake outer membrane protein [Geofilum rhodophaeum]